MISEISGPVQTDNTVMTGLSWLNKDENMIIVAYLHHEILYGAFRMWPFCKTEPLAVSSTLKDNK